MKKIKVIYNCSVNVVGGAVQNAVNFIKKVETTEQNDFLFYYLLSHAVYKQVKDIIRDENCSVVSSPAKSYKSRLEIKKIVKNLNPDIVYTNAGPAYVDFDCYHIMGCSNPYLLAPSKYALQLDNNLLERFKRALHSYYQAHYIKYADAYIFQTLNSKIAFEKKNTCIDSFIVSNAISESFLSATFETQVNEGTIKLLVPSAYYKHKNLALTVHALNLLEINETVKYSLSFTLKKEDFEAHIQPLVEFYGLHDVVKNVGPYNHENASELYASHDIFIQPSVLEVFSTTYLEAIATGKPLVASNLPFATEICEDYACYFEPDSAASLANAVLECSNCDSVTDDKKAMSERILHNYGSQEERTNNLLNILRKVGKNVRQ
ncbi:glycosyltransferase [Vibrio breoganii]|uniref:glycosyltransferase n=1 Tax=Vibrio breoganii TaxID=553239 RepID=UPI0021C425E5|nr:glycosyltransferase [Vibrio breoganii]MDN3715951.1 glycosyltransferase [Vibrio breoganii]